MSQEYLMYTASIMYSICYIPDLASTYRNKNANIYNVPEKLFMLVATSFALAYAVSINNNTLIINYTPSLILDSVSLCLRVYYAYKNRNIDVSVKSLDDRVKSLDDRVKSLDDRAKSLDYRVKSLDDIGVALSSFDSGSSLNDTDYYTNVENPLHNNAKSCVEPY